MIWRFSSYYKFVVSVGFGVLAFGLALSCIHKSKRSTQSEGEIKAVATVTMHGTIVNTTSNTWSADGGWTASMGPLNEHKGAIACDYAGESLGEWRQFRAPPKNLWFIAPSDSIIEFGMTACGPNPHGGEPSCSENWKLCGRKMRISCDPTSIFCAPAGSESLAAQLHAGKKPINNYIPEVYVSMVVEALGAQALSARSIVLQVNDFCPKIHSSNQQSGHCQSAQVDISTAAFLLLGKMNNEGYIDSGLTYTVELLPEDDLTPLGPEY